MQCRYFRFVHFLFSVGFRFRRLFRFRLDPEISAHFRFWLSPQTRIHFLSVSTHGDFRVSSWLPVPTFLPQLWTVGQNRASGISITTVSVLIPLCWGPLLSVSGSPSKGRPLNGGVVPLPEPPLVSWIGRTGPPESAVCCFHPVPSPGCFPVRGGSDDLGQLPFLVFPVPEFLTSQVRIYFLS